MADEVSKAVLITGCSTGIGRATALRLVRGGWEVYATARQPATLDELAAAGCRVLALDVTSEESMYAALAEIPGGVAVLINNAGYSQSGALETLPMESVRRQFETNVFGLLRLTQLVLPGMRKQGWGKVVNMSSMGANFVFPGGGFYHATKYAVDAISDALRFEVKGFGIDVIIIQPGLIKTEFGHAAVGAVPDDDGAYGEFNAAVGEATEGAYDSGPLGKLGGGPEAVAKMIEKAINSNRPKPRYRVTPSAHLLVAQRSLMTDRMWDRMMKTQFPQPKG